MNATTKAYKLVRVTPGTGILSSAIVIDSSWVLTYTPNQWTEANSSGIFVFDTLENCVSFRSRLYPTELQIWECECEDPVTIPYARNVLSFIDDDYLFDYWTGSGWQTPQREVPFGTVLYKRVMLTKQILMRRTQ